MQDAVRNQKRWERRVRLPKILVLTCAVDGRHDKVAQLLEPSQPPDIHENNKNQVRPVPWSVCLHSGKASPLWEPKIEHADIHF